jgi:hypothetical protein
LRILLIGYLYGITSERKLVEELRMHLAWRVRQGVADVEALAVEVEKPEEKRNWKAVLDYGQKILDVAGKAVDLGAKLGPYLPAVVELVDKAKHAL